MHGSPVAATHFIRCDERLMADNSAVNGPLTGHFCWHIFYGSWAMAKGKAWVGTSGWSYRHWKGTFYPKRLKAKDEFPFYSLFFNTVELNNPFYKLPSRETFESWRANSEPGFMFVVKASRFITHMKKLNDTKDSVLNFLHHCDGLEEKLGPVLFQLPPQWNLNLARFETFLKALPKGYRFAIEFRDPTWYTNEVYELLRRHNCAFCIYQLAGHLSPVEVTADWVYLRLHGPTRNKYQGSYDFKTLAYWASKSKEWQKAGKDVYIYFDNDDSGYAAFNAQVMELMLNKKQPITEHEAKVLALLIVAVRDQRKIRFAYEGGENDNHIVEPYMIAVDRKGQGDLFFSGFSAQGKAKPKSRQGLQRFLLKNINLQKCKILDETFEGLDQTVNVDEVFGKLPSLRIVYRMAYSNPSRSAIK